MTQQELAEKIEKESLTLGELFTYNPAELQDVKSYLSIYYATLKNISTARAAQFKEKLDKKRLEIESSIKKGELELEREKFAEALKLDSEKIKLEEQKLENEKERLNLEISRHSLEREQFEHNKKKDKLELGVKLAAVVIPSVLTFVSGMMSLLVYRKLAYVNANLIYNERAIPTNDFKDCVRNVNRLIN